MRGRKKVVRRYVSEHMKALAQVPDGKVDERLERECAYYPLFKFVPIQDPEPHVVRVFVCKKCTWEHPNQKCPRAHILIDTRIRCGICLNPNDLVRIKGEIVCKNCLDKAIKLVELKIKGVR